jgi:hypothetical protein
MQSRFLIAQLNTESLAKKHTRKLVRSALESLPKSLDEMYYEAIEKIHDQDEDDAQLVFKILSWISYAL